MKRVYLVLIFVMLMAVAACSPPPFTPPQTPQPPQWPTLPAWPQMPQPPFPVLEWFYGPFSGLMWILTLLVYLIPTIIAAARHSRYLVLVLLLNVLLGWTFVGWVVAFILALL